MSAIKSAYRASAAATSGIALLAALAPLSAAAETAADRLPKPITLITANYGTDDGEFNVDNDGGHWIPPRFVVDDAGNIFVLDTYNNRVRTYSPSGHPLGILPLEASEETPEKYRELDPRIERIWKSIDGIHLIDGRIFAYSRGFRFRGAGRERLFELRGSSFTDILSQPGSRTLKKRVQFLDSRNENLRPTPLSRLKISTQAMSGLYSPQTTVDEDGNIWLIGNKLRVLDSKGNNIAELGYNQSSFVSSRGDLYVINEFPEHDPPGFKIVEYPLHKHNASTQKIAKENEALCAAAISTDMNYVKQAYSRDPNAECGQLGETPLFFAVQYGHADTVKLLLSMGSNANARDDYGWTPLKIAVIEGNTSIASLLLKNGAAANAVDESGRSPLHYAVENGELSMVNLLLSAGADADGADDFGNTPLMDCLDVPIAEALLNKGAKIDVYNHNHLSVLSSAIDAGADGVAMLLISRGADVNAKSSQGSTPLIEAACMSGAEVLAALLAKGADINANAGWQGTPLHMTASLYCRLENAAFLIKHGADMNAEDSDGMTPLRKAEIYKNAPLMELLQDALARKEKTDALNEVPDAVATVAGFLSSRKNGPFASPVHDPPSKRETDYSGFSIPIGEYPGMFSALSTLGISESALLRNEIFARHGYPFKSKMWKTIFARVSWYRPSRAFRNSALSQAEKEDVVAIEQQEKRDAPPD